LDAKENKHNMSSIKENKTCREGCCLTNMLNLIQHNYELSMDAIDGYLLSMPIGVGRRLKVTYCDGNSGILIRNTKVKTLDPRGWGLYNTEEETLSIRFDKYVKLISVKEEIEEALWKCEQHLGYGDTYIRDLGGNLFVRVYGVAEVEIIQYVNNTDHLYSTEGRIVLSPEEWIYFNLSYEKICAFVPPVREMRSCIDNHTMCDGSLSCCIPS
jgi:hypothetical protein